MPGYEFIDRIADQCQPAVKEMIGVGKYFEFRPGIELVYPRNSVVNGDEFITISVND